MAATFTKFRKGAKVLAPIGRGGILKSCKVIEQNPDSGLVTVKTETGKLVKRHADKLRNDVSPMSDIGEE